MSSGVWPGQGQESSPGLVRGWPSEASPSSDDPRWLTVQRVARSKGFARSPVLQKFLLYVCEQSLIGHPEEIKEQLIGTCVFGRPSGYNPAEDNIVRVRARQLRERLDEYFATEGRNEALVISIPKGRYLPVFHARTKENAAAREPNQAPARSAVRRGLRQALPWGLVTVLAGLSAVLWFKGANGNTRAGWDAGVPAAYRQLWQQLYDPQQEALLIVGDSTFALVQDLSGQSLGLDEFIGKAAPRGGLSEAQMKMISPRQYTSLADLRVAAKIFQVNPLLARRTQIQFARNTGIRDLKDRNAILLGSPRGNPWTGVFESRLNFLARRELRTGINYFENRSPKPGEPGRFEQDGAGGKDFATVAFLPNLGNTGWVLILSGLGMQGTEAAGELVTNPGSCMKLLRMAGFDRGGPIGAFEVLLRLRSVAGASADTEIIAWRRRS